VNRTHWLAAPATTLVVALVAGGCSAPAETAAPERAPAAPAAEPDRLLQEKGAAVPRVTLTDVGGGHLVATEPFPAGGGSPLQ